MFDDGLAGLLRRWLEPIGSVPSTATKSDAGLSCPVMDWAGSGAVALSGHADGAPVLGPAALPALLVDVANAFGALAAWTGRDVTPDPARLLTGRAGLLGFTRRGHTSAGGATRLLRARTGWCAVTLAREDDVDLVPAVVGRAEVGDPWDEMSAAASVEDAGDFAARVRSLGMPAAALPTEPDCPERPWRVTRIAPPRSTTRLDRSLVVDLSSLWAGPLCAHLLGQAGATVVKVESTRRPDGARRGNPMFFDWLHAGHESVAVDFHSPSGRAVVADLIAAADIVIEASRPRALAHLGLAPEALTHRPGKVWVSITGYGRKRPEWVAFGDDAAVAGALVGWSRNQPVFCADAVADPLSGLSAALGVAASVARGGGHLIDLSMRDVAASFAAAPYRGHGIHEVTRTGTQWVVDCPRLRRGQAVLPPLPPQVSATARPLGADTAAVLRRYSINR
ncbi:CoA transferase [Nocardia sp. BSTN01]|uniref:CoA transferase n=1 Tax=Nocardia sp. BSTN01 TaxID=2783665 RepID=UPI0028166D72|nr:CoA transferase [Nocardia sp. BSTN01]